MGHRINERNSGHWTTEGEPKVRRTKRTLSAADKELVREILDKVLSAVEFDPDISEPGQTAYSPDGRWTDGGRFLISLTREQVILLGEIVNGL